MIEITVSNIIKSFSIGENILNGLSFQIYQGERVGILGKNGTGKTTLFKILTGEHECDSGSVNIAAGHSVGLLSQIPVYPKNFTVQDVLETAFDSIREIEEEMNGLVLQMKTDTSKRILNRYGALLEAYEAAEGYNIKVRMESFCSEWNISESMLKQTFEELSGGEKTRINLARLLLEKTDILLLDEPTNHLDLNTTEWLENYLSQFKGTILAISHDRLFLNHVVNRIIEIDDGKAEFYAGNYTFYAKEKERRYQEKLAQYKKEQAQIDHLEEAAEQLRMFAFKGNDKTYRRAKSMEKRIERIGQSDNPIKESNLEYDFETTQFRGNIMLSLENVCKSFESKILFQDLNMTLGGGERIGLIGDNGAGKSTLIKVILGEESPDSGKIKIGPSVKVGYLPQTVVFSNPESTLLDAVIEELHCTPQVARNRLGAFRFREDDVFKPISVLSGGERSRLRLCMLMNSQVSLLILDETTNHMDISSREWIEEALENFSGTLLFVSHDRYFIDRFATNIWELADGKINLFDGDYQYYLKKKAAQKSLLTAAATLKIIKPKISKQLKPEVEIKRMKKELIEIESQISSMEDKHNELQEKMLASATDYKKYALLHAEEQEMKKEIDSNYGHWEELTATLESLLQNSL